MINSILLLALDKYKIIKCGVHKMIPDYEITKCYPPRKIFFAYSNLQTSSNGSKLVRGLFISGLWEEAFQKGVRRTSRQRQMLTKHTIFMLNQEEVGLQVIWQPKQSMIQWLPIKLYLQFLSCKASICQNFEKEPYLWKQSTYSSHWYRNILPSVGNALTKKFVIIQLHWSGCFIHSKSPDPSENKSPPKEIMIEVHMRLTPTMRFPLTAHLVPFALSLTVWNTSSLLHIAKQQNFKIQWTT